MLPPRLLSRSDAQPAGYRELSPLAALHHLCELRVVDVREADEFVGPLGHIPGAELVPLSTVAGEAAGWDRDAALLLVCRSGGRSARAAATLAGMGFRALFDLTGGMLAWDANALPRLRGGETAVQRLAAQVHACFVAAAGGDVEQGLRDFVWAKGTTVDTAESLRRAVHALASVNGVGEDERAAWVAGFDARLTGAGR